jgi:transcription termination factor NusB
MLNIQETIEALTWYTKKFPEAALMEAVRLREEITPYLLDSLDYMTDNAQKLMDEADNEDAEHKYYDLHISAMHLLAQFKEKRAFPKLARLMNVDDETVDYILGDTLTERYAAILRDTYDGNIAPLKVVIENRDASEFVRGTALRGYRLISQAGFISREEAVEYFRSLIKTVVDDLEKIDTAFDESGKTDEEIENQLDNDAAFLTNIGSCVLDYHLIEMLDDIQKLYDMDFIDTSYIGEYDAFLNMLFDYDRDNCEHEEPIEDTVTEMRKWTCYDQPQKPKQKAALKAAMSEYGENAAAGKKVGRNDPCPCGSGKKYKKCCLDKDQSGISEPWQVLGENGHPYNLLTDYPDLQKKSVEGKPAFADYFDPQGIEIDMPVYKALYHRKIMSSVKRDEYQENFGRIHFLLEAFALFQTLCASAHIMTFDEFDKKYMVHYPAFEWVNALEALLTEYQEALLPEMRKMLPVVTQVLKDMDV